MQAVKRLATRLHAALKSCADCLQLLGLKSFRAGAVMLAGLLLYDVFWVFGRSAPTCHLHLSCVQDNFSSA